MLGDLKKVELRKAWNNEARDFTTWLAEPENISLLSDEIGVEIIPIQTEADVGRFNVDILPEEESSNRKIVIENQLESTDHDHLGKIITYASGIDAEIVIWIVKNVREEHKQAIDWLNEHTDEDANFFLVRIELWQIGDSPFAPKFYIVSEPNSWAKQVKKSAQKAELTETKLMQLEFWTKFKEYSKEKGTILKLRKARPQHWYTISVGSSDAHIGLTVNTRDNALGCELYIPDAQSVFEELKNRKQEIEKELGNGLEWMELPNKKASRIKLSKDAEFSDQDKWNEYFSWFKLHAEKFYDVFNKHLKNIT